MSRFTEQVFDLQDVKHVDAIYKSIEYIKRNYMKKVTLDEVAKNSSLSPTYFSRIFKKEMNYSFNNYLNRVRIEMSKKLLLDETIPLVDVSIIVGFEDQSYYSKVFKKITNISPGKYREKRGMYKT
jgi:YesN/AraC family two-component response regulator